MSLGEGKGLINPSDETIITLEAFSWKRMNQQMHSPRICKWPHCPSLGWEQQGWGRLGLSPARAQQGDSPSHVPRISQGYWWHHPQDITNLWERDCRLQGGEQRFSAQPLDSTPTLAISVCRHPASPQTMLRK